MTEVLCNINSRVRVRLTEAGVARWKHFHGRLGIRDNPPIDSDGQSRFMLWELMQVFGPDLHMGSVTPHFANNDVWLKIS